MTLYTCCIPVCFQPKIHLMVTWNRFLWVPLASSRIHNAAAAKSLQSCPALCDPIDGSPPGSPIPGFLQARTLEWAAISFNAWKWKVKVKLLSRVRLLATPWTVAYQAPSTTGFSRQEHWSGMPLRFPVYTILSSKLGTQKTQRNSLSLLSSFYFLISFWGYREGFFHT